MHLSHRELTISYLYVLSVGILIVATTFLGGTRSAARTTTEHTQITTLSAPLAGKAAAIYDITERSFLYATGTNAQLPIASLTKLTTSLVALEKRSPDDVVSVRAEALKQEGDSGLFAQERFLLGDLLALTLISSSNDGAAAVALALATSTPFVDEMNSYVRSLGLTNTYFTNATGLDVSESTAGAYSSAHDIALLFAQALKKHPTLFEKTQAPSLELTSLDGFKHTYKNTNPYTAEELGLFASKTGFTDLAGGNLAIAFDAGPGRPMIAVVLGSTEEERFRDIHTLIDSTFAYLESSSTIQDN